MAIANSSTPPILTTLGILKDSLDDICKTWEQMFVIIEKYNQKMEPFKDMELFKEEDVTKKILTTLPSEKAAALIAAITDMEKLDQSFPPEDVEKQLVKVNKDMANLQKIRDNLHKALDGVVS